MKRLTMDRLTIMTPTGAALKMDAEYLDEAEARTDLMQRYRVAIARLAAYEDTGLMPDDVTDLMAAHGTYIEELVAYRVREKRQAPKCYSEDVGGGCRYLVNDGDDEPIAKCKRCPLCCVDKQRKRPEPNEPLTLEELREMDGEAVWNETMQKWVLVDYDWECGPRTVDAQGRWRDLDDRYYRRRPEASPQEGC